VSDGRVIYPVNTEEENRLVALNASDGSVAWETPDPILQESAGTLDAVHVFVSGDVVIEARASTSSTAGPETPGPKDALRLAAYDLETGEVLWTSRSDDASWGLDANAINGCGIYPRVSGESLVIPCGEVGASTLKLISIPLHGSGDAKAAPESEGVPAATSSGFIAAETAWVYGTGDEIVRLDLQTGDVSPLGTMGGVTCYQQSMPTNDGFVCLTTNGIGTYYIQAFGPIAATPGITPVATPETSAVQQDARTA
jgi:outer membrane protein assembly factor BamB